MRRKITEVLGSLIIILLIPAWLYASGNLPSVLPSNQRIIRLVKYSFPNLAAITYEESHRAYEMLRDYGLSVPYSYNEQSLSVTAIRAEVIQLCNGILQDIPYNTPK